MNGPAPTPGKAGTPGAAGTKVTWKRPTSWRLFALRLMHLNAGLMLFGLAVAMMVSANVGLGPWDAFHQGVALRTPLTIGQAMVLAGLVLIVVAVAMARVRPGVGTVLNMALIGPWVDLFLGWSAFPNPDGGLAGWAWFLGGLVLIGVATGLYITAGLGAGPRDAFALALAERLGAPVRRARTMVEVVVLASGWLLGGTVGVGTLVFAVAIGPLMQSGLRSMRFLERAYARAVERTLARRGDAVGTPPL